MNEYKQKSTPSPDFCRTYPHFRLGATALLCLALLFVACFSFAGCAKSEPANEPTYEINLVGQEDSNNHSTIYHIILYPLIDRITINDKISIVMHGGTKELPHPLIAPFPEYQDDEQYVYYDNFVGGTVYHPIFNGAPIDTFDKITSIRKSDRLEFLFKFTAMIKQRRILGKDEYGNNRLGSPVYIRPDLRPLTNSLTIANIAFMCGETNNANSDLYSYNYYIELPLE